MSVKQKPASCSTGDAMFNLVAAVQRRAILDAKAGDHEAIAYLNVTMPDWRERLSNGRQMHSTSRIQQDGPVGRSAGHAIQED